MHLVQSSGLAQLVSLFNLFVASIDCSSWPPGDYHPLSKRLPCLGCFLTQDNYYFTSSPAFSKMCGFSPSPQTSVKVQIGAVTKLLSGTPYSQCVSSRISSLLSFVSQANAPRASTSDNLIVSSVERLTFGPAPNILIVHSVRML